MTKRKVIAYAILLFLIAIFGVILFIVGHQIALRDLSFKDVSATQAAQAMKNDEFFSDYNENTLVIHGTVSSTSQQEGGTIIGLETNSTYKTLCKLNSNSTDLKVGDKVTVEAIGGNAVRQDSAVLLQNCIVT